MISTGNIKGESVNKLHYTRHKIV